MVYLMIAEHYRMPGIIIRVCATRDKAVAEALACVNTMLADAAFAEHRTPATTEQQMEAALERLQDEFGAAHCYAEISEHEVIGKEQDKCGS